MPAFVRARPTLARRCVNASPPTFRGYHVPAPSGIVPFEPLHVEQILLAISGPDHDRDCADGLTTTASKMDPKA